MNKSVVIILVALWLFCTLYFTFARTYSLAYGNYAMVGSWIASALLLICIVVYIRKHKKK